MEILPMILRVNDTLAPSPQQVILVESMSRPRLKSKSPTTTNSAYNDKD